MKNASEIKPEHSMVHLKDADVQSALAAIRSGQWICMPGLMEEFLSNKGVGLGEKITDAGVNKSTEYVFFQTKFDVPSFPRISKALAQISEVKSADMYLNGVKISKPEKISTHNVYKVTPFVKTGRNMLAMKVKADWAVTNSVAFGMRISNENGITTEVKSDDQWLSALVVPEDWYKPNCDASNWNRVALLSQYKAICYPNLTDRKPCVTAYRRKFTIHCDTTVRVYVSADEEYELFIDGERIGRGPELGSHKKWFFDSYDLSLIEGDHAIVARVWSLGDGSGDAKVSIAPGFFFCPEDPGYVKLIATGSYIGKTEYYLGLIPRLMQSRYQN